jgi:PPOX class probable F420-dependent enzyme
MLDQQRSEGLGVTPNFDEATRAILDGKNFATVATLGPDGAPHTSVVWVTRAQDVVLFSTTASRQKARNLRADPRISVTIFDLANPYSTVEIRGIAELVDDPTGSLPKELSHKYLEVDPPPPDADEIRLIVRITPGKILRFTA